MLCKLDSSEYARSFNKTQPCLNDEKVLKHLSHTVNHCDVSGITVVAETCLLELLARGCWPAQKYCGLFAGPPYVDNSLLGTLDVEFSPRT